MGLAGLLEFFDMLPQGLAEGGTFYFSFKWLTLTFHLIDRFGQLSDQAPAWTGEPPEMVIGIVQVLK